MRDGRPSPMEVGSRMSDPATHESPWTEPGGWRRFEPDFTNDRGTCDVLVGNLYVMLPIERFFPDHRGLP